jgi:hypothetical protein
MATFEKCPKKVYDLAKDILQEFETHHPVLDADVSIDLLFAYGTVNDSGIKTGDAIRKNGVRALGMCRVVSLKDRAKGASDIEIVLDGDWWQTATEREKRALLDHELHHIIPLTGEKDDLGRPLVRLRKHDVDVGWFAIIAKRHGDYSQERQQAQRIMERGGQYFWPEIAKALPAPQPEAEAVA